MGISLLRAQGFIRSNTIESTGDSGISVVEPGPERSVVDGNDIKTAKAAGIEFDELVWRILVQTLDAGPAGSGDE